MPDGSQQDLDMLMRDQAQTSSEYAGVLAAMANSDPGAAHALVTDLLSIAGISTVGGRTVGEIADRFLEQSTLAGGGLPKEIRAIDRTLSRNLRRSGHRARRPARCSPATPTSRSVRRLTCSKAAPAFWRRAASM